jgi:response regulator RpfG family c-di-GMP phosphodiesterase
MDVIKSYSGSYFDPALVEVFLTLTENEYNDIISNIDSVNISNIINSAIRVVLNNKVAI